MLTARFPLPTSPTSWGRTPHPLSRVILDGEGWFECGAAFEHGAGDVEKAVGDGSEGSAVAVTSGSQGCILGAAGAVRLGGDRGPVVDGVGQAAVHSRACPDRPPLSPPPA